MLRSLFLWRFCLVCVSFLLVAYLLFSWSFVSFFLVWLCEYFFTWLYYAVCAGCVYQLKQLMLTYIVDGVAIVDAMPVHHFCDRVFCYCRHCHYYFFHCNGWLCCCYYHYSHCIHFLTNDFSFSYEQSMTYFVAVLVCVKIFCSFFFLGFLFLFAIDRVKTDLSHYECG